MQELRITLRAAVPVDKSDAFKLSDDIADVRHLLKSIEQRISTLGGECETDAKLVTPKARAPGPAVTPPLLRYIEERSNDTMAGGDIMNGDTISGEVGDPPWCGDDDGRVVEDPPSDTIIGDASVDGVRQQETDADLLDIPEFLRRS